VQAHGGEILCRNAKPALGVEGRVTYLRHLTGIESIPPGLLRRGAAPLLASGTEQYVAGLGGLATGPGRNHAQTPCKGVPRRSPSQKPTRGATGHSLVGHIADIAGARSDPDAMVRTLSERLAKASDVAPRP